MIARGALEGRLGALRSGCLRGPGMGTRGEPAVTRSKPGGEW